MKGIKKYTDTKPMRLSSRWSHTKPTTPHTNPDTNPHSPMLNTLSRASRSLLSAHANNNQ